MELPGAFSGLNPQNLSLKKFFIFFPKKPFLKKFLILSQKIPPNFQETKRSYISGKVYLEP